MSATFASLQAIAEIAPSYQRLRAEHPTVPAKTVHAYLRDHGGDTFDEFCCPGHKWAYTGSSYGGDDDSYHGEGRCYCLYCGKDGDT